LNVHINHSIKYIIIREYIEMLTVIEVQKSDLITHVTV